MKVAEIRVVRNSVRTRKFTQITSGMTGAQVVFDFPAEWAGLTKNVRFACGDAAADVINVKEGQLIDIPNEVLAVPFNNLLLVGVTGFNADGKEIVPTTWGCICTLRRGSDSGFPAEPSSPSWAVQIQNEVNRAVDTAEDVERRADEGEFNGDSAYEIAVKNGFVGTEEEWLESLKADSVPESTIDRKDAAVLKTAKDYADSKLVTIDIESRSDGSFWTMPIDHDDPDAKRPTSLDIINMVNAGKWVRLHFFDTVTDTGDQIYTYETTIDGVPIFRRPVISTDKVSRISIGVQYNGEVRFIDVSYEPPIQTAYAVCNDEAAPVELTGDIWYIPKTKPKPSGAVGMMLDVMWKNGRVNGLGYNPRLVWGAPGEVDNVEIVEASSVTDDLTGEYSIPVEGTVRYQLEEYSGRKRWRYVSGVLIPVQFSTATEADVADKLVPGLTLKYLPGMEVYLQMDKGNTAETMRLVPDEGQTLPVYGNGTGTKTGAISAGYILHLVNAGDHWQIMNGGSSSSGGEQVQSDWAENDPQSPAYVKNRFGGYEETTYDSVLTEGVYEFDELMPGVKGYNINTDKKMKMGDKIRVIWDSSIFVLPVKISEAGPQTAYYIGNASLLFGGEDTGEAFLIYTFNEVPRWVAITTEAFATHSFGLAKETKAIAEIDPKYVPSDVFFVNFINYAGSIKCNKTHLETVDAIKSKKVILATYTSGIYRLSHAYPRGLLHFTNVNYNPDDGYCTLDVLSFDTDESCSFESIRI